MKLELHLLDEDRVVVTPADGYSLSQAAAERIGDGVEHWLRSGRPVAVLADSAVVRDLRVPELAERLDRIEARLDEITGHVRCDCTFIKPPHELRAHWVPEP